MRVERIAAVAIKAIAVSALRAPRRVAVDPLRDAPVAAEEIRHVRREIDHEVPALADGGAVEADQHGLSRCGVGAFAHDLVRDEAALRERPQELVELLGFDVGAAVDEYVL